MRAWGTYVTEIRVDDDNLRNDTEHQGGETIYCQAGSFDEFKNEVYYRITMRMRYHIFRPAILQARSAKNA